MTISAVVPDIAFSGSSGSGTLGPFSLVKSGTPIVFYNNSEVIVYRYDTTSDTAPTLLVEGTDYTLTGGPTAGSITLTSPQTGLLTAERLYVFTKISIAQALDLVNGGSFSSANIERRLDIMTAIMQQLDREIKSTIRFAMFDTDEIPKTTPLGAVIDKIPYVTGTASSPTVAYLDAEILADLSELSDTNLANIATVAADLAGADTIGIVAAAIDEVEDVAASIADVNTVADFLNAGQFGSLSVTSGSDTQTLANWLTRVDRKDPTTLQLKELNFTIADDPTDAYYRRVGALWYNISSVETRASQATWLTYTKTSRLVSGNEIGRVFIGQWNDMASGAAWGDWSVATSPLNPSSGLTGAPALAQSFYVILGEGNPQNRHGDPGYTAERRLQDDWVGGWQWTPETQDFSGLLGGARRGYNVLFQHCYTHSPYTATDTQLQAKTYNLHLVEPNAVAPGGVVIMAQGHRTFVASAAVSSGGTGYVAGDVGKVVTVSGGGGSDLAATIEITAVSAGAVTGIRVYTGGRYDTSPSSPAATSGGGTTGSGLTVSLTMSTATSDPNAIIDADDFWETAFDFRKATFRDAVLGNNQAARFVQPQGLAWSTTAGGTPYNAFGVSSVSATYCAAVDNAAGVVINTRANGKTVLLIDTQVGASITDYCYVKGTASAGGEIGVLSSNANANLVLRPLGTGDVLPATDGAINLGGGSNRFETVYATTGTINTSDARYKTELEPLSDELRRAVRRIMAGVGTFQWLDAVARKGEDGARIHIGPTAQAVEQAFLDEGLDPGRFALFCEDELTTEIEIEEIVSERVPQMVEVEETVTSHEPGPVVPAKGPDGEDLLDQNGGRIMVRGPDVVRTFKVRKMVEAFDDTGHPLLETVETVQKRTERVPVLDENGRQVIRKGLRTDQIMMLALAVLFKEM